MHFGVPLSFIFTLTEIFNRNFKVYQTAFHELLGQTDYLFLVFQGAHKTRNTEQKESD